MPAPLLLANPIAAAGRAKRAFEDAKRAFEENGIEIRACLTERAMHAKELVAGALEEGAPGVIVIGGDGTLSEALEGFFDGTSLRNKTSWLAPFPCGTGGDFKRTLDAQRLNSVDLDHLVTRVQSGQDAVCDVGRVYYKNHNGEDAMAHFINVASFGLGGRVTQRVNASSKWMGGQIAFLSATLRAMLGYSGQHVKLRFEGLENHKNSEYASKITNVAIANGRYFGGGMHIAPRAELSDGFFDVVAISGGILRLLSKAPAIYTKGVLEHDDVMVEKVTTLHAEPANPCDLVLIEADGECIGSLPARFEVVKNALLLR